MKTSLKTLTNNSNHSVKYNYQQLSSDTQIVCEEGMSTSTNKYKIHQGKEKKDGKKYEGIDNDYDDNDDENSKLVAVRTDNSQAEKQEQHEQQSSTTKLRSILRKPSKKKISMDDL